MFDFESVVNQRESWKRKEILEEEIIILERDLNQERRIVFSYIQVEFGVVGYKVISMHTNYFLSFDLIWW